MARWAWRGWWLAGLTVPFVQLHATSVEDSGWIALALWLAAAGWLSLWTPRLRTVRLEWLAMLIVAWLVHPLCVSWPAMEQSNWVDAWGLVARVTASGCFALCFAWGTASALQHSPAMHRVVPWALALLLAINLVGYVLQVRGGFSQHGAYLAEPGSYTRWVWNVAADLGGFFSSKTVWSAVAILALPVTLALPRWRKLAAIPSLWAVLISNRTTVFVALMVWLVWWGWPWIRRHPRWAVVSILTVFLGWWWQIESLQSMWIGVQPRLATWPVILQAIAQHPLGIGWNPMAYHAVIAQAGQPIMGHPSSSLLAWTLAGGWVLGLVVLGCVVRGARWLQRDDGLSGALVVACVLLLISRTLAQAQVGVIAWMIACSWWIQQHEDHNARMA